MYNKKVKTMKFTWLPNWEIANYHMSFLLVLHKRVGRGRGLKRVSEIICSNEAEALVARITERFYGQALAGIEQFGFDRAVYILPTKDGEPFRVHLRIACPIEADPRRFAAQMREEWSRSVWADQIHYEAERRFPWEDDCDW